MAEIVIREPTFFRTNQQCDAASCAQPPANQRRTFDQQCERLVQFPIAGSRCAHNQRAISYASATLPYCSACASNRAAPTAERASRNDASYGFTTRSRENPRLLMARAAAPMLSGFRVETSTTHRRSNSDGAGKTDYSTAWLSRSEPVLPLN